ncbi:fructose-1-phosphate kinase [Alkalispirochaeta americana]|uniref:1-phosphofructokinase n=1 Tax=Alkalispirochaeta americana TaxID=159291 RepID=A0A1N6Q7T4_9SPIO|nr:1-phosphofructokinase [Alkalispirochaeta americana]SIQ12703.1 fructose-1-phosphate kinase [Alkalispirochaeta americana]
MIATVTINPAIDETVEIPGFRPDAVNRVNTCLSHAGGKGVNVAAALADYGVSVCATGFLGTENDAIFRTLMSTKGIEDHFLRIPGSTRRGIKIVDSVAGTTTDINYPGLTPELRELDEFHGVVREIVRSCEWIVVTGSIPPGVPETIYADIVRIARDQGCRTALDTSGAALRHAVDAGPSFVKPNVHELAEYAGRPIDGIADIRAEARGLIEKGVSLVAISMGEEGALLQDADGAVRVYPAKVDVRSTVGAGDAMVAGILAGFIASSVASGAEGVAAPVAPELESLASLGAAFSAAALSHPGTGIQSPDDVQRYRRGLRVERL